MEEIAIVDAPTLIENNLQIYMDYVILVMVDEKTQILRVIKRDLQSKEEVLKRIRNQLSLEEKIQYADYVIDNSKDLDFTKSQLAHILNDILLRGKNEKI